jgi:hypothetical protein
MCMRYVINTKFNGDTKCMHTVKGRSGQLGASLNGRTFMLGLGNNIGSQVPKDLAGPRSILIRMWANRIRVVEVNDSGPCGLRGSIDDSWLRSQHEHQQRFLARGSNRHVDNFPS